MLNNLKALVVVLGLAWAVFAIARPVCLRFMSTEVFALRRNVWMTLTCVAFASPAFWIYAAAAAVVLLWAGRRDSNPLALFALVTFAVPDVRFYLPGLIFNNLFDLTQYRLLSLTILLPLSLSMLHSPQPSRWSKTDAAMLGFMAVQILVLVSHETFTNTLRRSFLLLLDTLLVFYAFSRLRDRRDVGDVMACYWIAALIMATLSVFEWGKGWLLYDGLGRLWGNANPFSWIYRGGGLRAQAAAMGPINLGYVLSIAVGCSLYLLRGESKASIRWLTTFALLFGLYVTGSRGPWVATLLVVAVYTLIRPGAMRSFARAALFGAVVIAAMYFSPLKESILDRLPLIGSVDQDTVDYRRQLFDVSWPLILQNPWFGDPFAYRRMEELRQGQGIIDIVNGYLYAALFTGFVGLGLLLSVFAVSLWRGIRAFFAVRSNDFDAGSMGAALVATMIGSLFYVATAGYGTNTYIVVALLMSYSACILAAEPTLVQGRVPRARPIGAGRML